MKLQIKNTYTMLDLKRKGMTFFEKRLKNESNELILTF